MARICDICGQWYLRRNLSEAWTERNPGHRAGWKKEVVKVCTNCQSVKVSLRMLNTAQIYLKHDNIPVKKRRHG